MMYDGLFCAFDQVAMGAGTEKYAASAGLDPRAPQDDLAAKSHERAAAAIKEGRFADEIVPVEVPQRQGDPVVVDTDEGVRPGTTVESLAGLRPAFDKAGNITAGNASQISDGGAAVIVVSKAAAERLGVEPLGEVVGYGQVAGPDPSLLTQPSRAINAALESAGKSVGDIDLFELNEAFAAVGPGVDGRPRHHRRRRQRQRRRHRPRPPGRHVGHPRGAHAAARAQAPGRRASVPPPCAAAAARATPSCSRPDPPGLLTTWSAGPPTHRLRAGASAGSPGRGQLAAPVASTADVLVPRTSVGLHTLVSCADTSPVPESDVTTQRPPS